ncbi:hypothetical protein Tco_0277544 [Tanacetum coccineum]
METFREYEESYKFKRFIEQLKSTCRSKELSGDSTILDQLTKELRAKAHSSMRITVDAPRHRKCSLGIVTCFSPKLPKGSYLQDSDDDTIRFAITGMMELAKSRAEVAHEISLAREAEAIMDAHVNKEMEKAAQHDAKLAPDKHQDHGKADGLTSHHGTVKSDSTNHSDGNSSSNIPEHLSKFYVA